MMEFASGYRQVKVSHLTRNYFPLVTPEPTPEMYTDSARRNPRNDPDVLREQQLRRQMYSFFALSGLALLVAASFGKPEESRAARRELQNRNVVRTITTAARMPYSVASVHL